MSNLLFEPVNCGRRIDFLYTSIIMGQITEPNANTTPKPIPTQKELDVSAKMKYWTKVYYIVFTVWITILVLEMIIFRT